MPRPIILSNGTLAVGINNYGLVHDFYYPFVGLENHATSKVLRHRVGVWVDGVFSWLDDGFWRFTFDYEPQSLLGLTTAVNEGLGITIHFRDAIDSHLNVLLREVTVSNDSEKRREVRLMMHQVFQISNSRSGDTAQYLPDQHAIFCYKGRRMFVIRAEHADGRPFDQFSIGIWGIEGREGTYKDAEDGELAGNAVEHGSVDSVVRLQMTLDAHSSSTNHYWVSVATTMTEALDISDAVKESGFASRFRATARHWEHWLSTVQAISERLPEDTTRDRFFKSLLLMKSHIDHRGAVIASLDTQMLNYARDAYAYCWPRDAVFVLWPLVRLGYRQEAREFFDFCRSGLHEDGYLMHKYQADRAIGSSWHPYIHEGKPELPIQEDETALVLFLIGQYHQLLGDDDYVKSLYDILIKPMASFLVRYTDADTKLPHASYDLWEQKFQTTTFTTATVYTGLTAAAKLAESFGDADNAIKWQNVADDIHEAARHTFWNEDRKFFYKGFIHREGGIEFDQTIDVSSFYGAFMFGLFDVDEPELQAAYTTLMETFHLDESFTGLPRYEYDQYNIKEEGSLGNPWFVTSLWLAQYYLEINDQEKFAEVMQWVEGIMLQTGVLSEQASPHDYDFVSVAPLAWSQAEYVSTLLDSTTQPSMLAEKGEKI